ncbi:MAG: general secretion pathway protein GspK [Candidatus Sumerlaeia bacterium]|nr:general secretion pathway protein GspK [Candidatus Sumerlaeia bacterium]
MKSAHPLRRGLVFVIVLWVATALVSVAIYFSHAARLAYLAADEVVAGRQAEHAIEAAIGYISSLLESNTETGRVLSRESGDYQAEAVQVGGARFWFIGQDANAADAPGSPVFGIVDEASKLNLNTATIEMLEKLPGVTPEIAAAILDWRDVDSELTVGGAESQDYLLRTPAHLAKDSDFESPEELRLVRGMDLTVLYGEDWNRNGALDPNEDDGDASWPPDNRDGRLEPGLVRFVTVHSREPNARADGNPRVNLRGQSARQDLALLIAEQLGPDTAAAVLTNVGNLNTIESVLEFYIVSGMSAAEFARIENDLTVRTGDYQVGLVSIGTAPREVLACLPGMTEQSATQVVTARLGLDATTLQSVGWIVGVLDVDTCRLIGPHITARSFQYGLDVAAVGRGGRGFRRTFAVVDVEQGARTIYRRDLARFGWPLGEELREQLRKDATP